MIEARIVIADDKWGSQLGAKFNVASGAYRSGRNVESREISTMRIQFLPEAPAVVRHPIAVNLPVAAAGSGMNILNIANGNLVELGIVRA